MIKINTHTCVQKVGPFIANTWCFLNNQIAGGICSVFHWMSFIIDGEDNVFYLQIPCPRDHWEEDNIFLIMNNGIQVRLNGFLVHWTMRIRITHVAVCCDASSLEVNDTATSENSHLYYVQNHCRSLWRMTCRGIKPVWCCCDNSESTETFQSSPRQFSPAHIFIWTLCWVKMSLSLWPLTFTSPFSHLILHNTKTATCRDQAISSGFAQQWVGLPWNRCWVIHDVKAFLDVWVKHEREEGLPFVFDPG